MTTFRKAWRGDRWSPVMGNAIDRRLARNRCMLARALSMDDETEIDAMIDDLSVELRRCWCLLRDVNRAFSDPAVRKTLTALLKLKGQLGDAIWRTDPNTRALIEDFWPGGWRPLEEVEADDETLRQAIEAALRSLPPPDQGRPAGSRDHTSYRLGLALAEIYSGYAPTLPRRRVRWTTQGSQEYGPYRDFLKIVIGMFPPVLRRYKSAPTGAIPKSVDSLVRIGVKHILKKTSRRRTRNG